MDLSVIILNYNTKNLLRKCLQSVFASKTDYKFEVLVADNGSSDGSAEMVKKEFSAFAKASADKPPLRLIENKANLGYSKGNNVALRQASGRYCLLLNSDTEVGPGAFNLSIKYMDEHLDVGALSPKLLLPDGSLDQAARRKFPNPYNSFLRLFGLKKLSDYNITSLPDLETEIDSGVGAYLLVRKSVIDKVGFLDEDFFMYGEDLDWCWRIKEAGFRIMYNPNVLVTHYKYGSVQSVPFQTIRMAHNAMKIFYRKHYASKYPWLFNQFVYLGINLRMGLVLFLNLFRGKKTVH